MKYPKLVIPCDMEELDLDSIEENRGTSIVLYQLFKDIIFDNENYKKEISIQNLVLSLDKLHIDDIEGSQLDILCHSNLAELALNIFLPEKKDRDLFEKEYQAMYVHPLALLAIEIDAYLDNFQHFKTTEPLSIAEINSLHQSCFEILKWIFNRDNLSDIEVCVWRDEIDDFEFKACSLVSFLRNNETKRIVKETAILRNFNFLSAQLKMKNNEKRLKI